MTKLDVAKVLKFLFEREKKTLWKKKKELVTNVFNVFKSHFSRGLNEIQI